MTNATRFSSSLLFAAALAAIPTLATSKPPPLMDEDIAAFTSERTLVALATRPGSAGIIPGEGRGASDQDSGTQCALEAMGSDHATSESCLKCHSHRQSHPYDVDYAYAAATQRTGYASAEQVVRKGVLLPNGEIRCVTCHDRRSPWKYKIALPPGSTPSPSVPARMRDGTFEREGAAPVHMVPGSEVTPTPLCKVCHQF